MNFDGVAREGEYLPWFGCFGVCLRVFGSSVCSTCVYRGCEAASASASDRVADVDVSPFLFVSCQGGPEA